MKNKLIALLAIIICLSFGLIGCSKPVEKYTITFMLDEDTVYKEYTDSYINTFPIPTKKGVSFYKLVY